MQDAPEEETYPEDEHTGEAAVPDAQAETDADGETMPPSVSDLCNGGETDAAELDKLLDDIINAAE